MAAVASIFDASLQKEVDHTLEIDQNNEIVATSTESGTQVKFPAGLTKTEFEKALKEHKSANEGQEVVPQEELEAREAAAKKSRSLLEFYDDGGDKNVDADK